jgi:stage V sporulation protein B
VAERAESSTPAPPGAGDPPPSKAGEGGAGETARSAGRGGLAIAVAKISFIVFGFAQQLVLPRLLGVDGYGAFRLVFSIVSIVNNVVVAMAIQGVSREVSQVSEAEAPRTFRRTLGIHVWLSMVLSLGVALAASSIADFVSAPQLTTPFRVAAAIVLLYGIYAPLVGSLNGRRRFLDQAGLDIVYGVVRLTGVLGGAFLLSRLGKDGVVGAVAGTAVAAALIIPVALSRTGTGASGGERPTARDYLSFLLPLTVGQIFLNCLMQTDSALLSRFVGQAAGTDTEAGIKLANTLRGVYGGAQLFAFLPYQMLMSITFILFPMLASAKAKNDHEAVRSYTMTGVRLAFVLTGLMCGAVSATAPHVLRLSFPEEVWTQGGDVLRILSLGMGAFAILGITCAALTGLGRATTSMLLTALGVGLIAAGCVVLVPKAALGPAMLVQAATATTAALVITAIIAGVVLRNAAGGFVAKLSLARVLVAVATALFVGSRLPWIGKLGAIVEVGAVGALYLVVLVVLGELGKQDVARIRQVIGRRA